MKFWKRGYGALKDRRSLLKASFTQRSAFRNPDIEAAVIKATSHDESCVDYRNAQRVFAWVGISDEHLRHVLWALSHRMWRTHDWVVVLKGLMLLNGVFCTKVPGIQEIGRLPFDMMNFKDKRTKRGKLSGLNEFIRAYYAFLDEKSSFIFFHSQEQRDRRVKERMKQDGSSEDEKEKSMMQDLIWLQKLQGLLDLLLHVRPTSEQMLNVLVLEAMDCVVIEICDICGRICNGIRSVLGTIYSAGKSEAEMALRILQKVKVHREKLPVYFQFCREIRVGNACECPPNLEEIPEEGIRELEQMINGNSEESNIQQSPEEKSIILVEHTNLMKKQDLDNSTTSLKTVIVDDWEVFSDEQNKWNQDLDLNGLISPPMKKNGSVNHLEQQSIVDLPDLISF